MEAQNGAHGCDCGKVKVTLLSKRNAAEALTAPLDGKAIAIDNVADLIYIIQTDKSGYTRRTTYKYNPYVNPYNVPYGGQQMQQQMYQPQMHQLENA